MDSEVEVLEQRLNSFMTQLQAEYGVLDRLVYKNKNQHRRCSYFQYLLKVRRDLRLLKSVHLEDILSSCFHLITGKKPRQKVQLLESLKKRKCDGGRYNFLERLLGAARLLSQIVEPMLRAATDISTLLAQSFFMGFSLTSLALLARLRVLVQQILLDVVSVFNMISSLSQKPQSIEIFKDGIKVFREYYPTNEEVVTLECVWKTDKFVLHERTQRSEIKNQDANLADVPTGSSAVQYHSIEAFLGDDEPGSKKAEPENTEEGLTQVTENLTDAVSVPSMDGNDGNQVKDEINLGDDLAMAKSHGKNFRPESGLLASANSTSTNSLKQTGSMRKVAFVSVKKPTPSTANLTGVHAKESEVNNGDKEDPFFSLLTGGNLKESLF